ncbi:MAG: hypothetical protein SFV24_15360 [Gemmatimonadales bacterium]|nr:hypothetical protein [Gemmatimonadales bacterium]
MTPPPACKAVGPHCLALSVTLRLATADGPGIASADHEATWLLGHTQRIQFGPIRRLGRTLEARSRLLVPCRHAAVAGGRVRCRAHGFQGAVRPPRPKSAHHQLGNDRFSVVDQGKLRVLTMPADPPPRRSLPIADANPCAVARCRTADHTVGAACCRDLQIEVLCGTRNRHLEALIRHRKSPYLCKVSRESPETLGAEMISACGFLEPGGVLCTLHGRHRPDGRTAKPDLCFTWPTRDDTYHPNCAFHPASGRG